MADYKRQGYITDMRNLSVKNMLNIPSLAPLDYAKNSQLFLCVGNIKAVTKCVINKSSSNGKYKRIKHLKKIVPVSMHIWADKNKIDTFESLTSIIESLSFLNKKFIKDNSELYSDLVSGGNHNPDLNVYDHFETIGRAKSGSKIIPIRKKYEELMASDIPQLDVWAETGTDVYNNNFRYKNKIPAWQRTMNTRHYDRTNDGLKDGCSDRASLENPIRGYDMSVIYEANNHHENQTEALRSSNMDMQLTFQ
jgi:hypothetical protein